MSTLACIQGGPPALHSTGRFLVASKLPSAPTLLCPRDSAVTVCCIRAVQVLRRSSVDVISPFLDPYLDVIMSVEGTRMRLLALSSLVPGASTLIANLLRSSGPNAGFAGGPKHSSSGSNASRRLAWASSNGSSSGSPTGSEDSQDEVLPPGFGWQKKLQAAVRSLDDVMISHPYASRDSSSNSSRRSAAVGAAGSAAGVVMLAGRRWLREYAGGAHCELFMVPAGPPLAGLRFTDAAQAVYEASWVMVVGVIEVNARCCWLGSRPCLLEAQQPHFVVLLMQEGRSLASCGLHKYRRTHAHPLAVAAVPVFVMCSCSPAVSACCSIPPVTPSTRSSSWWCWHLPSRPHRQLLLVLAWRRCCSVRL